MDKRTLWVKETRDWHRGPKSLYLGENASLLDALKASSFLHLQFDDELNEEQIEKVKETVKQCRDYFARLRERGGEIPQKIDSEQARILIKCLNLLKDMNVEWSPANEYLTNRSYSKWTFESARGVIKSRDENYDLKEEPLDNDYVRYEDASRCCDLVYQYLSAASLDDYKIVLQNRKKAKARINKA